MKENIAADVAQSRKIALYLSIEHGWYSIWEVRFEDHDEHYTKLPEGQQREMPRRDYIRCSEIIEIKFSPINNEAVVANAVEALNEAEREVLRQMNAKIAEIRERKSQLLALSYQPEEA